MHSSGLLAALLAAVIAVEAAPYNNLTCTPGTYACQNSMNAPSNVRVCSLEGLWLIAATCPNGSKCFTNDAGGCTCKPA
ncbi:hypothetical protein BJ166DRAFT_352099 [Pestalotiopsis sp. NC0098]|nr:hypothetical protein BJ166DRAFT_352099 [Pestalotiopsis sp. NC0098]